MAEITFVNRLRLERQYSDKEFEERFENDIQYFIGIIKIIKQHSPEVDFIVVDGKGKAVSMNDLKDLKKRYRETRAMTLSVKGN